MTLDSDVSKIVEKIKYEVSLIECFRRPFYSYLITPYLRKFSYLLFVCSASFAQFVMANINCEIGISRDPFFSFG